MVRQETGWSDGADKTGDGRRGGQTGDGVGQTGSVRPAGRLEPFITAGSRGRPGGAADCVGHCQRRTGAATAGRMAARSVTLH